MTANGWLDPANPKMTDALLTPETDWDRCIWQDEVLLERRWIVRRAKDRMVNNKCEPLNIE